MLHRIKEINGSERIRRIMQFQRKVLAFVSNPATPDAPDQQAILDEFDVTGEWVWSKLRKKSGEKSDLCKDMERAIRYCKDHPAEGAQILAAFDHDLEFYDKLNDPNFQFHYSVQLGNAARELRWAGDLIKRHGTSPDDVDFRVELESMLKQKTKRVGKEKWYILQTSYLHFALKDNGEFDLLLDEFKNQ